MKYQSCDEVMSRAGEKKVLIVDDEECIREILTRVARREGAEAVSAGSAGNARLLLQKESFRLVISDLRMPGETDGSHLIRWIKANFPELPVVVISAYADVDEETLRNSEINSDRVVIKPFQISEISDIIHGFINPTA